MTEHKLDPNKLNKYLRSSKNSYYEVCPVCKAKLNYSYNIELDCYTLKCPNYTKDCYLITLRTPDLMNVYKDKTVEQLLAEAEVKYEVKNKPAVAFTGIVCKTCGKPMLIRTSRYDGKQFYGCSGYPDCKSTLNITK